MSPTTPDRSATDRLLAERYGTERDSARRRRGIAIAVATLVVLLLGYIAMSVWAGSDDAISVEHVGYEVADPATAVVRFNVTAPEGSMLVCTLTAVSENFTEVGYTEVPVGPLDQRTVAVEESVTTVQEAASATVEGCRPA